MGFSCLNNNNSFPLVFSMTITSWSFGYCYGPWWNRLCRKIHMYFSGHFDDHAGATMQYSAHCPMEVVHGYTGSHQHYHLASMCTVLPWRPPWSSILAQKIELWQCEIAVPKLVLKRCKSDTLLSSLKQWAAWKKGKNGTSVCNFPGWHQK